MLYLKVMAIVLTSVIAITQALDKKKNIKVFTIICVVVLLVATMSLEFITARERARQEGVLDRVLTTNQELNANMKAVQKQLDPFVKTAEKRYPDLTKEEGLKKLEADIARIEARAILLEEKTIEDRQQISDLKNTTEKQRERQSAILKYAEVATWNYRGDKSIGGGITTGSPASRWMKDYVEDKDGQLKWKCDSSAIAHYKGKIKELPDYPFPYYFLALCLKTKKDDAWQEYAKDGIEILRKTTIVPGHDPGHDDVLQRMKELIGTKN